MGPYLLHACIDSVDIKGHVETVDTKDQSNAIVYLVGYLFCIDSVDIYSENY